MNSSFDAFSDHDGGVWKVSGKGFCDERGGKVLLHGVTYGPFRPGQDGPWPEACRVRDDMGLMRRLGFNVLRVYELPTKAVLEACREFGLRLLVGVPWSQHVDFVTEGAVADEAVACVRKAAETFAAEPVVMGLLVGNEIEKTLVRWMGPDRVRAFLERLIGMVHDVAPCKLAAYAGYPSTEYLTPRNADFVGFNVFLEERRAFAAYLQRLQNVAGDKPLVITEFGLDTLRHGETGQAEARRWQAAEAWKAGVAGSFWFAFTDEWHRGGEEVTDWAFGLVKRDRRQKMACGVRLEMAEETEGGGRKLTISVVVCTRNGESTLRECLEALTQQRLPPHEVLIVDDGSTDATPQIAADFPQFRYLRQEHAGLSAGRNRGWQAATGEVVAYTDDDCMPDEAWLWHLGLAYAEGDWAGAGGPNLSPPARSLTEACVAVAPGAPAHVLMNDVEAEHLPGCNLSLRRSALEALGGFREEFKTAGDDVDVCWRLLAAGGRLRYVPGAVVWHHRRFTVRAYLRQQAGYGRAEAMLIRRFPERFAWLGGARWRGAIYGDEAGRKGGLNHRKIHFGRFGLAPFQCVYAGWETGFWTWPRGLPWLTVCGVLVLTGFWLGGLGVLALGLLAAQRQAGRQDDGLRKVSKRQRVLLWFLCLVQPVARDWARLKGMVALRAWPKGKWRWEWRPMKWRRGPQRPGDWHEIFWSEHGATREELLMRLETTAAACGVWLESSAEESFWDWEVRVDGRRWLLTSVTEYYEGRRRLTRVALRSLGWRRAGLPTLREWLRTAAVESGMTALQKAEETETKVRGLRPRLAKEGRNVEV